VPVPVISVVTSIEGFSKDEFNSLDNRFKSIVGTNRIALYHTPEGAVRWDTVPYLNGVHTEIKSALVDDFMKCVSLLESETDFRDVRILMRGDSRRTAAEMAAISSELLQIYQKNKCEAESAFTYGEAERDYFLAAWEQLGEGKTGKVLYSPEGIDKLAAIYKVLVFGKNGLWEKHSFLSLQKSLLKFIEGLPKKPISSQLKDKTQFKSFLDFLLHAKTTLSLNNLQLKKITMNCVMDVPAIFSPFENLECLDASMPAEYAFKLNNNMGYLLLGNEK
jgi:hypothetical protein